MVQTKHSIRLYGHATSVTLEPEFWAAVKSIAALEHQSLGSFVEQVDSARNEETSLSSALRLKVLSWYQIQKDHI